MQDVLHNNSNRQELLLSVWRAFLSLIEHALKVTHCCIIRHRTSRRHVSKKQGYAEGPNTHNLSVLDYD
jgi:hypothetical protein